MAKKNIKIKKAKRETAPTVLNGKTKCGDIKQGSGDGNRQG
jgi:hypothetical protein